MTYFADNQEGMVMEQTIKQEIARSVQGLKLPHYREIPNVGLFLDQTAKYISEFLKPLQEGALTGSMISNYVKKGLIANPVKKQYDREQIAYLIFIAVAKSVLTLEEIQWVIQLQKLSYPPEVAYEYFCQELENVMFYVFGLKEKLDTIGSPNHTEEKTILRNTVIAVAHKAYLNKCLAAISSREGEALR